MAACYLISQLHRRWEPAKSWRAFCLPKGNGGSAQREVPVLRCGRRHVETTGNRPQGRVTPRRSFATGVAASIDMSVVGTFRTWRDVCYWSVMRTKADTARRCSTLRVSRWDATGMIESFCGGGLTISDFLGVRNDAEDGRCRFDRCYGSGMRSATAQDWPTQTLIAPPLPFRGHLGGTSSVVVGDQSGTGRERVRHPFRPNPTDAFLGTASCYCAEPKSHRYFLCHECSFPCYARCFLTSTQNSNFQISRKSL